MRYWIATILACSAHGAATCDSLTKLKLALGTVISAVMVPAGDFTPRFERAALKVPEFCRVEAILAPSSDSDIKIEVWLPAKDWNGNYQAMGNGGWAGVISYAAMAEALKRGYATSSTDTGHVGGSGSFALGHPEKLDDFGSRAVHDMAVKSKAIATGFYGVQPKYSYWNGCSTGGRQGLKEVQMYPDDFQGVLAGAPANPRTGQAFEAMWIANAVLRDPASYIPPAKYPVIHKAVLEKCDALDGVKDGVLDDPRKCQFDPDVLLCKSGDGPDCLTAPQVEAARKIYTSPTMARTPQRIFPGLLPGTELGWAGMAGGPEPNAILNDHFKYVVFKDPAWDWKTLDFEDDYNRTRKEDHGIIDAVEPNIQAFLYRSRLILYHGWADPLVSAPSTIQYYDSVLSEIPGGDPASKMRLYMVPGMGHCGGGDGPNTFDMLTALEQWVEKGKAPASIVASHSTNGKVDRTRPLCPYPQVAKYKGSGSTDEAANFSCSAP